MQSHVVVLGLDERDHLVTSVRESGQFPEMEEYWSPDVVRSSVADGTGLAWWKKSATATEHQVSVWTGVPVDERKILKFVVPGLPSGVAWDGQSFGEF